MQCEQFTDFDTARVPSPAFVVDEAAYEANLAVLKNVADESGAKILAALKAFSYWHSAYLVDQYLSGICASGIHEARLGREEYCGGNTRTGEVHTFSAGFKPQDMDAVLAISDTVVYNSFSQWQRFKSNISAAQLANPKLQIGLRINPEHSEGATPIYDPCAPNSRLGITRDQFDGQSLEGVSGLHFHTLCEQSYEPLARTLAVVEEKFADFLPQMQWVNFGGGHHITQPDYPRDKLIALIKAFSKKYNVQVYMEPGEALAIRSGVLVGEVLDVRSNGEYQQAILDLSATCHMPDILEMPYRPDIFGAGKPGEFPHTYTLGGLTCLSGDVIGTYSFVKPLQIGQRLMFDDMAHYTMVKTTTFNGTQLPAIVSWNSKSDALNVVRSFGYEDFKMRLS